MSNYKLYPSRKIHNLREMLDESASRFGISTAFLQKVDGKYKPYSYNRFKSDVDALGTALTARGFAGKRIIVTGENCYMWCVSYMTAVCGLGVVVPVDKEIPAEEIANIAKISEASLILYSKKYEHKLASVDESVTKICFDDISDLIFEGKTILESGNRDYFDISIDVDALCSLIFTSGTTGVSKGVMLSQRNLCTTIENLAKMVYVDTTDTALSVLPLHHVYECTCGFLYPVYCGASVAFSEGVRYIMKNMKEIRPTKMLCVPLLIETMYKKIWSNIRKKGIENKVRNVIKATNAVKPYSARIAIKKKFFAEIHDSLGGKLDLLVSGGAPIDPEIIKGMRDFGITIIQGYGLTESAPLAAVNHDSYFSDRSAGLVLPGGELKIIDKQEDGTGEICYRGDNVMLGYYNRPDLTAEVKKNGWLHTGDIGFIDERGFLVITGRKKNVIVRSNGKNVFPEELEAYLLRNELVGEAVVLGIMNEKKGDYDIVAAIHPNYDYAKETMGEYTPEELEAALQKILDEVNGVVQTYKKMEILIVSENEFPKNTSKKIKRFELPALLMDAYLEKKQSAD
ncbi:MAG: long-chain fatty acid--CoA ligase [Ruminococcaceae bacterium]|nr:long-chain fatty acid--CoA ligase [Oscillospiraceae bacterium]